MTIQWNLSIKDTLNKGHPSVKHNFSHPTALLNCITLSLNYRHLHTKDSFIGPNGVHYREVLLCILVNCYAFLCLKQIFLLA